MAKERKARPTYHTGDEPMRVSVHDFMSTLEMFDKHGLLDKFKAAAEKNRAALVVHPKTINFVKKFVADNDMHRDSLGAQIVNERENDEDPYTCNFGQGNR